MIGGNCQSCVEEEAEVYKTISTINPAVVTSYYRQFVDLPLWTAVLQSVLYQLMLSITIDLLPPGISVSARTCGEIIKDF